MKYSDKELEYTKCLLNELSHDATVPREISSHASHLLNYLTMETEGDES
jgi:hypothetical protein